MPRNETIINVFVASPSDVLEERKALESIVLELNKTWSKRLNVRLDLIKWETDVFPGFGKYPQDVINQQINDDYDIFVAIYWSKIGTPTPNAVSGSTEELERAIKKHINNPKSVDIMIYFKDQAISPSKMDFLQLQKIQSLKDQLGEKGGLYWTFDNTEDFESLLRGHLSKVAQKWSENIQKESHSKFEIANVPESSKFQELEQVLDEEAEYGLLDYMEIYEERMSEMTTSLGNVTEATEKVGKQFVRRTDEINLLQAQSSQVDVRQAKKLIKFTCDDMEKYADVLEPQLQIISQSRKEVFDALSKALALQVDFMVEIKSSDLLELEGGLVGMRDSAYGSNEMLLGFREMVASLPKLTISLNKSKRRVVKALNEFFEEFKAIAESAQNVIDIIRELKNIDN